MVPGDYSSAMETNDPVLQRFRTALNEVYGGRLERVVLYGSRARGESRPDSDYDIAVFLKNFSDLERELDVLAKIEVDILDETGAVINAMPFHEGAYNKTTGFMREVRRDGRDL
jgi:predicted nucleotidyltransferase